MFDQDPPFVAVNDYHTSKEKRIIKKMLFNEAKADFSNLSTFRMSYYQCVHSALADEALQGKELDKRILQCKIPVEEVKNYIDRTNQHARIKVKRCIKSKRDWERQWGGDLAKEEIDEWECINRYHRRYLYYYPGIRDKLVNKINIT